MTMVDNNTPSYTINLYPTSSHTGTFAGADMELESFLLDFGFENFEETETNVIKMMKEEIEDGIEDGNFFIDVTVFPTLGKVSLSSNLT